MQSTTLILLLAFIALAAFYLGRSRSLALAGGVGQVRVLHSLPGYYGYYVAIWCAMPALALFLLWTLVEPRVIVALVVKGLPATYQSLSAGELDLLVNNIQNLAAGDVISVDADAALQNAAAQFNGYAVRSRQLLTVLVVGLAGLGGAIAWRPVHADLRPLNR